MSNNTDRIATPTPDHIESTRLAATLLALAGYGHPTRAFTIDTLQLIADALDSVNPDNAESTKRAKNLALHFRQWTQTIEEDISEQIAASEEQGNIPTRSNTAPVMHCGPALAAAFDASGELRRLGLLVVQVPGTASEQHYVVSWTIDIDAATPLDAAIIAKRIQQRPESIANVFDVTDVRGRRVDIDLDEHDRPAAADHQG